MTKKSHIEFYFIFNFFYIFPVTPKDTLIRQLPMCSCQLPVAQTCFAKVNKTYYKSSAIYFDDMVNALVNKKTTELQAQALIDTDVHGPPKDRRGMLFCCMSD